MKVVVPRETAQYERRVACVPDTVTRLLAGGLSVSVERGAGLAAGYSDEAYVSAGAQIADRDALKAADVVLAVQPLPL
ncbi:MAG TPA: NAD(P)(+) transhydrogenase (Re/Si-specific) subunit alpha, partial [Acidothermaceae bacterium]